MIQIKLLVINDSGLIFEMDKKATNSPRGKAKTRVNAKISAVLAKPDNSSNEIEIKFILGKIYGEKSIESSVFL